MFPFTLNACFFYSFLMFVFPYRFLSRIRCSREAAPGFGVVQGRIGTLEGLLFEANLCRACEQSLILMNSKVHIQNLANGYDF